MKYLHILITVLLFLFNFVTVHPSRAQVSSKEGIMLILGSSNPKTLQHRVNVATQLYNSKINFNRIIVSGGCGAHGSSICEASRMDSLLLLNGIPGNKIFKEEKSNSTKQNYCYSKKLSKNGQPLIGKEDNLYIVSDHWHAIPVASCFRKAVGVDKSTFHIEGTIKPRGAVDYTQIFKECTKNNYCRSMLWAFVDAAYFDVKNNKIYYFVDDIYYRLTPTKGIDPGFPKSITQYPDWPINWNSSVDAAYFNPSTNKVYLFKDSMFFTHTRGSSPGRSIPKKTSKHFNLPANWEKGYFDAAYYNSNSQKAYFFKNSEFLIYSEKEVIPGYPLPLKEDYPIDWPFQWGSGDLDAAYFNLKASDISLFRGTTYLEYSPGQTLDPKYPTAISLPWPESIWGVLP